MADVFISYARVDRRQAEQLASALQAEGFTIWWDLESLRSGKSFNRAIQQALEQAKCVVVLWTSASVASKWVEAEAYWAWEHEKLHSVRLDDALRLPVPFNTFHARTLASWDGRNEFRELRRLVEDIAAVTGPREPATTAPSQGGESGRVTPQPGTAPRSSGREPLSSFRDPLRDGGEGPEMVVIPGGSFWMGSPGDESGRNDDEGPQHQVEISTPFALGKTPVTFADYDRYADATGKDRPDDAGWGRGSRPVINVDWGEAVAFAEWLSEQTAKRYRLPTEAEWEYACRAETQTPWFFGDEESDLNRYAWHWDNSGGQSHPVGEKEANPWGLHDMHGNVWEWVQDCWHDDYRGAPADGSAWEASGDGDCGRRVLRGGSWSYGRGTSARPTAAGPTPTPGTTSSVSVSPRTFSPVRSVLLPFGGPGGLPPGLLPRERLPGVGNEPPAMR